MRKIPKPHLTAEEAARIWSYDPDTGYLYWKTKIAKNTAIGRRVGYDSGRYTIVVYKKKKKILAHRIAWAIFYGEWPALELDHINNIKTDNRIANLRLATPSQNLAHRPVNSDSLTGVKGVTRDKRDGYYYPYIDVDGKRQSLGRFKNIEDANAARIAAEKKHRGEFFFHRS